MSTDNKKKKPEYGDILDYVWIEEYRIIRKQGFNLSRKYTYEYDEDKSTLTRTKNPNYIDNFFGDKVEVNAVIGMNGAGKTSFLSALISCFGEKTRLTMKRIVLAFRSGKAYCLYFGMKISYDLSIFKNIDTTESVVFSISDEEIPLPDWECLFHSGVLDFQSFNSELIKIRGMNISISAQFYEHSDDNPSDSNTWDDYNGKARNAIYSFFSNEFSNQINLLKFALESDIEWFSPNSKPSDRNLKWPEYATIYVKSINMIRGELTWMYNHVFLNTPDLDIEQIDELLNPLKDERAPLYEETLYRNVSDQFRSKIAPGIIAAILSRSLAKIAIKGNSINIYSILVLNILSFIVNDVSQSINEEINQNLAKEENLNLPWEIVKKSIDKLISDDAATIYSKFKNDEYNVYNEYYDYEYDEQDFNVCLGSLSDSAKFVESLVELVDKIDGQDSDAPENFDSFISYILPIDLNELEPYKGSVLVANLDIPLPELFEEYRPIGLNYNFLEFSWNVSSGEQSRLALFSKIYYYYEDRFIHKTKGEIDFHNLLILLDEADMLLHPEWQRTYVEDMIAFLNALFKNDDIHIQLIIATHSPIMLSDIPKQNTLYLKKDSSGKTKEASKDNDEPQETFAANIFSLYQDSFFIQKTGIGAFAEEKLKDIVKWIHEDPEKCMHSNEELEQMIEIVGDDYLRSKLKNEFYLYRSKNYSDDQNNLYTELRSKLRELEQKLALYKEGETENKPEDKDNDKN